MANEPTKAPAITTLLPRLRASNPLIYCLSNNVTAQFVANVLYAVGASPLFCVDPLEAEDVAGKAGAMVVNLGTLDAQRRQAIDRAVPNAKRWVLDPVGIAGLSSRRTLARTLMTKRRRLSAAMRVKFWPWMTRQRRLHRKVLTQPIRAKRLPHRQASWDNERQCDRDDRIG